MLCLWVRARSTHVLPPATVLGWVNIPACPLVSDFFPLSFSDSSSWRYVVQGKIGKTALFWYCYWLLFCFALSISTTGKLSKILIFTFNAYFSEYSGIAFYWLIWRSVMAASFKQVFGICFSLRQFSFSNLWLSDCPETSVHCWVWKLS